MYPIIEKRFISEVLKYKRTPLGKTEHRFLNLIAIGDKSAYRLCTFLKQGDEPISYKNVRKTLLSLLSKGLIEDTGEKLPHGAKAYKLTPHGLFQCLLQILVIPGLLKKEYQNCLIMKNILYLFFDIETINEFVTIPRISLIAKYLNQCCEAILKKVEQFKVSKSEHKKSWFHLDVDNAIRNEVLKLIFEIVLHSNLKTADIVLAADDNVELQSLTYKVGEDDVYEGKDNKHYLTFFPNMKLRDDNKFTKMLNELKKDFDEGYKNFT